MNVTHSFQLFIHSLIQSLHLVPHFTDPIIFGLDFLVQFFSLLQQILNPLHTTKENKTLVKELLSVSL